MDSNRIILNQSQLIERVYKENQIHFEDIGYFCNSLDIENVSISEQIEHKLKLLEETRRVNQALIEENRGFHGIYTNNNPNLDGQSHHRVYSEWMEIKERIE